jgi:hypothetical protein
MVVIGQMRVFVYSRISFANSMQLPTMDIIHEDFGFVHQCERNIGAPNICRRRSRPVELQQGRR